MMKNKVSSERFSSVTKTSFIWGLSSLLIAAPLSAKVAWGGVKMTNPQEVLQSKTVSGQVLDEKGEPMIGVSVLVKGTKVGVITDIDGNFKLTAPSGATVLQLTYMGYKPQNVRIEAAPLIIHMQPEEQQLDEVVVVGYGSVRKRDLTGSVASVGRTS